MIVALEDADARFGGKAAGLAQAIAAGLPVPAGVALLPRFEVDRATLESATRELPFPWAVRSSALGEDGNDASFAGIHLTKLGVVGTTDALAAIDAVVASASSDGARAYRKKLGLGGEPAMGVVIQVMVAADVAGVMFTRDPRTGADVRVVEGAWGLGEVVVSGAVTPDVWRLAGGRVIEQRGGFKDVAVRLMPNGATREVEVPEADHERLCLGLGELHALDGLATACEAFMGAACDIEWAFTNGRLQLLQCRRITR